MLRPAEEAVPASLGGRWWVAHTKPRAEKSLAYDLTTRGVFCYLPICRRQTRSRTTGRTSTSLIPVFASYLFVNGDENQRRTALATQRVVSTLVVHGQQELIAQLQQIQRVLASESPFEWGETLETGDWVRVTAGPLAGVEGVVVGRLRKARLALNVTMLSQSVRVEVDRSLLERIDPPAYTL